MPSLQYYIKEICHNLNDLTAPPEELLSHCVQATEYAYSQKDSDILQNSESFSNYLVNIIAHVFGAQKSLDNAVATCLYGNGSMEALSDFADSVRFCLLSIHNQGFYWNMNLLEDEDVEHLSAMLTNNLNILDGLNPTNLMSDNLKDNLSSILKAVKEFKDERFGMFIKLVSEAITQLNDLKILQKQIAALEDNTFDFQNGPKNNSNAIDELIQSADYAKAKTIECINIKSITVDSTLKELMTVILTSFDKTDPLVRNLIESYTSAIRAESYRRLASWVEYQIRSASDTRRFPIKFRDYTSEVSVIISSTVLMLGNMPLPQTIPQLTDKTYHSFAHWNFDYGKQFGGWKVKEATADKFALDREIKETFVDPRNLFSTYQELKLLHSFQQKSDLKSLIVYKLRRYVLHETIIQLALNYQIKNEVQFRKLVYRVMGEYEEKDRELRYTDQTKSCKEQYEQSYDKSEEMLSLKERFNSDSHQLYKTIVTKKKSVNKNCLKKEITNYGLVRSDAWWLMS